MAVTTGVPLGLVTRPTIAMRTAQPTAATPIHPITIWNVSTRYPFSIHGLQNQWFGPHLPFASAAVEGSPSPITLGSLSEKKPKGKNSIARVVVTCEDSTTRAVT